MTMTTTTTTTATANPNHLLDLIIEKMGLKNDAALSRALGVAPPVISKIRHLVVPFGSTMVLRAHDVSGMPLNEIRSLLGVTPYQRADRAAV